MYIHNGSKTHLFSSLEQNELKVEGQNRRIQVFKAFPFISYVFGTLWALVHIVGISLNLRVQGNLIDPQFKIFQLSLQLFPNSLETY